MKFLPVFCCCLLLSSEAFADDTAKPIPLHAAPQNVEVINGKRFFSLSNARRFTGSTNDPKALSVLHHPRGDGTIASRHISPLPFANSHTMPKNEPAAGTLPMTQPNATNSDKVLSVFAPDESGTATK